jgi:hypothetical protein
MVIIVTDIFCKLHLTAMLLALAGASENMCTLRCTTVKLQTALHFTVALFTAPHSHLDRSLSSFMTAPL